VSESPRSFRASFRRIDDALSAPGAGGNRDALKAEIIALFRAVDAELAGLSALKEDIKQLVTRWKALGVTAAAETPTTAEPPPPVSRRIDSLNASSHIEKGWSLISLGEYLAAEDALRRALALAPDETRAIALLGWAQMLQQDLEAAQSSFSSALGRDPANALARVNLGYIYMKKGSFAEAVDHLSRTIRLDNDRTATLYAHYYLGLLYAEREMFEESEVFLKKAMALGPNLVEAYYELGRTRQRSGDMEGARQAWRDGAAQNKFSPWGKRCARALEQLDSGVASAPS
jgi:tetratricopeptide (TPR) repeat protein